MSMDQPNLIVSVSGVRGVVGQSLTPEVATAFAGALGTYLTGRPVVLSRDSRPSGEMLRHAVAAGLMSTGSQVYDLGIAPTPTCGLAIRQMHAAGGVQITASHNPAPYNGLKLFGPQGMVLTAAEGEQVVNLFPHGPFRRAAWHEVGASRPPASDPFRYHLNRVLEQVDARPLRQRGFRVFVDANHGAGGPLALQLLQELGCEVVPWGCTADGQFAHEPEPTETNLRAVAPRVREHRCDLGLALDPDSDRLAIIDETGRYIGEELTLALATAFRLRQSRGPVVVNMSTSRLIEDIATRHGCPFHRTPVGEAHVAGKILAVNAVIGGEGNGGVIDPRVGLVRDPFIGIALILSLLAEAKKPLSAVVAELPSYHIVKDKYTLERSALPKLYQQLQSHWPAAQANHDDGLRLDWPDRWVHVRSSNTEPIIRVIAEAPREEEARRLCQEVGRLIGP
jgi:phosphomannomutase